MIVSEIEAVQTERRLLIYPAFNPDRRFILRKTGQGCVSGLILKAADTFLPDIFSF
jgi:hypothetical protein